MDAESKERKPHTEFSYTQSYARLLLIILLTLLLISPTSARNYEITEEDIPRLIETLKADSPIYARFAAEALGELGSNAVEAVPALIEALSYELADRGESSGYPFTHSGRSGVRGTAAWALGEIGPAAKDAIPRLIEMLDDKAWDERLNVIIALGKFGPMAEQAIPAIIEELDAKDIYSIRMAAKSLGRIGLRNNDALDALRDRAANSEHIMVRREAKLAASKIEGESALLELLTDEDWWLRAEGSKAVIDLYSAQLPVIPALEHLLNDPEPNVGIAAAYALTHLQHEPPTGLAFLEDALKNENWEIRGMAAEALSGIPHLAGNMSVYLVDLLDDQYDYPRDHAIETLGLMGEDIVPDLIIVLDDDVSMARAAAAFTLSMIGEDASGAIQPLMERLGDPDSLVRNWAAFALGSIGMKAVPSLIEKLGRGPDEFILAACALGMIEHENADVIEPVLDACRKGDDSMIFAAGQALAGLSAEQVSELLSKIVEDDREVYWAISYGLYAMGPKAAQPLIDAVKSGDSENPEILEGLLSYYSGDWGGAVAAADEEIYEKYKHPGLMDRVSTDRDDEEKQLPLGELILRLSDENEGVRRNAALAIKELGTSATDAIPALLNALSDEGSGVASYAAQTLAGFGAQVVPELIGLLSDTRENTRMKAAYAIMFIGPEAIDAVPRLIVLLSDPDVSVRLNAIEALGSIGYQEGVVPALVGLFDDPDDGIRRAAVIAISKIGPYAKDAAPALIGLCSVKRIGWNAAEALGNIGIAEPEILRALRERPVGMALVTPLAKIKGTWFYGYTDFGEDISFQTPINFLWH